ncbi:ligase-associated DNA damage response DEXH box helicase [Spiribacter vilamensis]|uniref:ATP-dependent Lhr-like helicase n=1 Tax=Spiribacter vilamensis TaxID=531306 RepID=A0A4Q8CYI7_9GAMM|nr:ligase-associated DNA damage response DEXH box helicase [Spiribacter vilamensis]RZU98056.1 ATP-dependent Lhr-like helicase [Spiribacter vilamensis]
MSDLSRTKLIGWFADNGWQPADFQHTAWDAYTRGESGLIHSATGSGKSLAAWGGPLIEGLDEAAASGQRRAGFRVLWITPLRALAGDTVHNLATAAAGVGLDWRIEKRTGDTSSSARTRQRRRPPEALVTTPESLSLLLSYRDAGRQFESLQAVIVDEWHELIGTKRGVQLELCLARLRRLSPGLRTWGLSATLGNLDEARDCLLGAGSEAGRLVEGPPARPIDIRTLEPDTDERFPWAGHLGTRLINGVIAELEGSGSCLLFTNTRSQAELWFESLVRARPDWIEGLGLHHGSIDRSLRDRIEAGLAAGEFRCVVATASLDLGVDFAPVDRVIQVGSPKGVARLAQRAGRSGHQPGRRSTVLCVPTNALEMIEIAAARRAWAAGEVEARRPLRNSLDVLAQHLVTLAAGDGFDADRLYTEVRDTHAFAELDTSAWQWTLDFITRGGPVLAAYPDFQRVVQDAEGTYRIAGRGHASRHRMGIGTITSDAAIAVCYQGGGHIGTIEESFIARLRPGDVFLFAGRSLALVRVRDLTAYVRRSSARRQAVPRWQGGRLPLSTALADHVLALLAEAAEGRFETPEMAAIRPLLSVQAKWSSLPRPGALLIERTRSREGEHLFIYPFAGRLAHEGLATLFAWRLGQQTPATFSLSVNDYGFELLGHTIPDMDPAGWQALFDGEDLVDDLMGAMNASELARRQFRDIARVAGLVFQGYPGKGKSARQLQASSGLMFDTIDRYDPDNRLIHQARREVLDSGLEVERVRTALQQMARADRLIHTTDRFTPLAFPLWAERLRNRLTTQSWQDRVARMVAQLEKAAGRS